MAGDPMSPQCECGRFVKVLGARHNRQSGYASAWYAVGKCSRCGEVSIDWDWLPEDFDPEAAA
jgi:hypothetical protein